MGNDNMHVGLSGKINVTPMQWQKFTHCLKSLQTLIFFKFFFQIKETNFCRCSTSNNSNSNSPPKEIHVWPREYRKFSTSPVGTKLYPNVETKFAKIIALGMLIFFRFNFIWKYIYFYVPDYYLTHYGTAKYPGYLIS